MIKAVTTRNTKKVDRRTLGAEVEIEGTKKVDRRTLGVEVEIKGTKLELLNEFMGILDSLEDSCPDVILKALQLHMEENNHDN